MARVVRKTFLLNFRVSLSERERLRARAIAAGVTMSQWVRQVAVGDDADVQVAEPEPVRVADDAAGVPVADSVAGDSAAVAGAAVVIAEKPAEPKREGKYKRHSKCTCSKCGRLKFPCCGLCMTIN